MSLTTSAATFLTEMVAWIDSGKPPSQCTVVQLGLDVRDGPAQASRAVSAQAKRIDRLNAERQRLVQAYVADALPRDLRKADRNRITRELAEADTLLNAGSVAQTLVLDNLGWRSSSWRIHEPPTEPQPTPSDDCGTRRCSSGSSSTRPTRGSVRRHRARGTPARRGRGRGGRGRNQEPRPCFQGPGF